MIFEYLKRKFGKKTQSSEPEMIRSHYLPSTFMVNKPVSVDQSFNIFIKNSVVDLPSFATPTKFVEWELYQTDPFEEILLEQKNQKFLYDKTNDTLYFLQLIDTSHREEITNDSIHVGQNIYESITDVMEITDKDALLRIYNREISHEADEYLFVEVDKKLLQKCWAGVIIEPSLLN